MERCCSAIQPGTPAVLLSTQTAAPCLTILAPTKQFAGETHNLTMLNTLNGTGVFAG
jgi:hypothetical protein